MPLFRRKNNHGFKGGGFSPGKFLSAPFRFVFGFLSGSDSELGHQISLPKRIFRTLLRILFFPVWFIGQVLKFLVLSWTTTRDGGAALWGLIPLAMIFGIGGIVFASGFVENRFTKSLHRQTVVEAEEVEDHDTAVLCSRRVQNINQQDTWKFIHGMTLIRAGLTKNGMTIVREMADPGFAGYLPAHVFLAQELLKINKEDPAFIETLETVCNHLKRVEEKHSHDEDPSYMVARKLLPKVQFEMAVRLKESEYPDGFLNVVPNVFVWIDMRFLGEFSRKRASILMSSAIDGFEKISGTTPEIVPELATYLIENREYSRAKFQINRGVDTLRNMAQINANVPQIWTVMYEILMVREEDYERAEKELMLGLKLAESRAVRSQILSLRSNIHVKLSRSQPEVETQDGFRRRLIPLCTAIWLYPRNKDALHDLVDLVVYPPNNNIQEWVQLEARENVQPAIYHVILGVRDTIIGKPATAGKHFRLAFNSDARSAVLVNNLALVMCMDKGKCGDALRLIDVAINTWTSAGSLFQTRGLILMKLGRYSEAKVELEYAAEQIPEEPEVFRGLAECYENLNRQEQAVAARKRAVELQEILDEQLRQLRERLARGS